MLKGDLDGNGRLKDARRIVEGRQVVEMVSPCYSWLRHQRDTVGLGPELATLLKLYETFTPDDLVNLSALQGEAQDAIEDWIREATGELAPPSHLAFIQQEVASVMARQQPPAPGINDTPPSYSLPAAPSGHSGPNAQASPYLAPPPSTVPQINARIKLHIGVFCDKKGRPCNECVVRGYLLELKTQAHTHITQKHLPDLEDMMCSVCNKGPFKNRSALADHTLLDHSHITYERSPTPSPLSRSSSNFGVSSTPRSSLDNTHPDGGTVMHPMGRPPQLPPGGSGPYQEDPGRLGAWNGLNGAAGPATISRALQYLDQASPLNVPSNKKHSANGKMRYANDEFGDVLLDQGFDPNLIVPTAQPLFAMDANGNLLYDQYGNLIPIASYSRHNVG
jgi:hypothetical protein